MRQRFDAVFENGLLRPLEPLNLSDHERVSLIVESGEDADWLDHDAIKWAQEEGDPGIPLEDVRRSLAKTSEPLSDVVISERGEF